MWSRHTSCIFFLYSFIFALEKILELFFYEGDTFGAPPVYFVLLNFFCSTFGDSPVSRFYLSAD